MERRVLGESQEVPEAFRIPAEAGQTRSSMEPVQRIAWFDRDCAIERFESAIEFVFHTVRDTFVERGRFAARLQGQDAIADPDDSIGISSQVTDRERKCFVEPVCWLEYSAMDLEHPIHRIRDFVAKGEDELHRPSSNNRLHAMEHALHVHGPTEAILGIQGLAILGKGRGQHPFFQ